MHTASVLHDRSIEGSLCAIRCLDEALGMIDKQIYNPEQCPDIFNLRIQSEWRVSTQLHYVPTTPQIPCI